MNQIKVMVNGIPCNMEQLVANYVLTDERFEFMRKQKAFWKNLKLIVNSRFHCSEYGQTDWWWILKKILH